MDIKSLVQGIVIVALGFAFMIITFQGIISFQEYMAKSYMQSHCEKLSDVHGNKWFECDE